MLIYKCKENNGFSERLKERFKMKFYVVSWIANDVVMTKTYKRRKSAERFGCEMLEKFGNAIHISTFLDTELISTDVYN